LLVAAVIGAGLFALVEKHAAAPLLHLALFRDPTLSAGFAMSSLVTTVVMATLVVGPFYLAGALGLDPAQTGVVMSCGPIVAALAGVPAGRIVDWLGARRMTIAGLSGMAAGSAILSLMPIAFGVPGYVAPLILITAGYALFQAANNTAIMVTALPKRRGVTSGLLNLSRNLGLITSTSVMGTIFALGSALATAVTADSGAVVVGMRLTFAVAAVLIVVALTIALISHAHSGRLVHPNHEHEGGDAS
jgi:MFS family permease